VLQRTQRLDARIERAEERRDRAAFRHLRPVLGEERRSRDDRELTREYHENNEDRDRDRNALAFRHGRARAQDASPMRSASMRASHASRPRSATHARIALRSISSREARSSQRSSASGQRVDVAGAFQDVT
jgi:hypothetical protein